MLHDNKADALSVLRLRMITIRKDFKSRKFFIYVSLTMVLVLLLTSWLYFPDLHFLSKSPADYFAMCLIVKNDHLDIVEWIEYHRRLGCSKFYVHDHNSTVPMKETIGEYIASGLVEYEFSDYKTIQNPQLHIYKECLQKYGKRHRFMGFVDSDEFIVVVDEKETIPSVLKRYEQFGGLSLNWRMFGTSGHIKRPPGGILANYHKCGPNHHIKSIVNTQYGIQPGGNPHNFLYRRGKFAVDTAFKKAGEPWNPINLSHPVPDYLYKVMYVNHYNLKSVEDYALKVAKGKADNSPPSDNNLFDILDNSAQEDCEFLAMRDIVV